MENWTEKLVRRILSEMPAHEITGPPGKLTKKEAESAVAKMSPEEMKRSWAMAKYHIRNPVQTDSDTALHANTRHNIIRIGKAASRAMKAMRAAEAMNSSLPAETEPVSQIIPSAPITFQDPGTGTPMVISPEDQQRLRDANRSVANQFHAAADASRAKILTKDEKKRRERVKKSEQERTEKSRSVSEDWLKNLKEAYIQEIKQPETNMTRYLSSLKQKLSGFFPMGHQHADDFVSSHIVPALNDLHRSRIEGASPEELEHFSTHTAETHRHKFFQHIVDVAGSPENFPKKKQQKLFGNMWHDEEEQDDGGY